MPAAPAGAWCSEGCAPASVAPLGGGKGGCYALLRRGSGTLCQLAKSKRWHWLQKRNYSLVLQEHVSGIPLLSCSQRGLGVEVPQAGGKVVVPLPLPGREVSPLLYGREEEAVEGE